MGGWSGIDISGRERVRCCCRLLNGPSHASTGRVALCSRRAAYASPKLSLDGDDDGGLPKCTVWPACTHVHINI